MKKDLEMTDTAREKLKAIVDGLEGVTPGPWSTSGVKFENGKGYYRRLLADDTWLFEMPITQKGDGAVEDIAHIARCDPDTMWEIGELVDELDAHVQSKGIETAEAQEAYGRAANACEILQMDNAAKDTEIAQLQSALYAIKTQRWHDEKKGYHRCKAIADAALNSKTLEQEG